MTFAPRSQPSRPAPATGRASSLAAVGAVERTLRSPARLALAVGAFVFVLSWLGADQQRRALTSRIPEGFGEIDMVSLLVPELAHNALWALLSPLLLLAFVATWRRMHPLLFVTGQVALCLGAAWSMGWAEHHTTRALRDWIGPPVIESDDAPTFEELQRLVRERRRLDRAERERRRGEGGALDDAPPSDAEAPGPDARRRERPLPGVGPVPDLGRDRFGPAADGTAEDRRLRVRARQERLRTFGLAPTAPETASRRLPREVLFYLIALGLSGSAFTFLARRESERRQRTLELEAAQLASELSRAKLRTLRAQLNPHFLFNALHGIGGLVRAQRADEALRTLTDLGTLLRRTLDSDRADRWPLGDELELVDEYLSIESVRLGDRLTIERDIDSAVRPVPIPPLVLLPIVENAIRHGIAAVPGPGRLRIEAHTDGRRVRVVVEDTGPGFPDDVLVLRRHPAEDEVHVGLFNTRERLQRLFPSAHRFELANPPTGGARVTIELPCNPDRATSES